MLPSETMIWQPEFTDKTLSRKPGAVQMAAVARKRLTHKEIKVFVKNPLKDLMVEYCEREGITQAQFIEKIIKDELQRLDILK